MMIIFEQFMRARRGREERAEGADGGFTLVEMLVVVAIIGILVAVAIPIYLNYRRGSELKSIQADVRSAVNTVQACANDNQGKVASGAVTSTGVIYLTCKADGTGTASSTDPSGGSDQKVNLSNNVELAYVPSLDGRTFALVGTFSDHAHPYVRFDSSTGKTTVTKTAPTGNWGPVS